MTDDKFDLGRSIRDAQDREWLRQALRRVSMDTPKGSDHSPGVSFYDHARMEEQKQAITDALWRGICKDPARIEEYLNDAR